MIQAIGVASRGCSRGTGSDSDEAGADGALRLGHPRAAVGPGGRGADRGDLLPGAGPRLAGGRVLGDRLEHGLGGGEDRGHRPARQGGVERLDLGGGGLLAGLDVAAGGGQGRLRHPGGEPLGAVELVVGAAELAAADLVLRRLPGLGDLAAAAQGRAADLVPGQVLDPFQHPGRLARVELGADLAGDPVGQAEPRGGQGVRGGAHPLGQVQVVDRPGQVVGLHRRTARATSSWASRPRSCTALWWSATSGRLARASASSKRPARAASSACRNTIRQCPSMMDLPSGLTMGDPLSAMLR